MGLIHLCNSNVRHAQSSRETVVGVFESLQFSHDLASNVEVIQHLLTSKYLLVRAFFRQALHIALLLHDVLDFGLVG